MAAKQSAGVLLFRRGAGGGEEGVEVLLVHPGGPFWAKRDLGAWSMPKGEPDAGEDLQLCALRELGEELGDAAPRPTVAELIELGTVKQKSGKRVHGWAAPGDFDPSQLRSNAFELEWPPRSGRTQQFPEADRAEWFGPEEARRRILPAQAPFVDRLLESLSRSA